MKVELDVTILGTEIWGEQVRNEYSKYLHSLLSVNILGQQFPKCQSVEHQWVTQHNFWWAMKLVRQTSYVHQWLKNLLLVVELLSKHHYSHKDLSSL